MRNVTPKIAQYKIAPISCCVTCGGVHPLYWGKLQMNNWEKEDAVCGYWCRARWSQRTNVLWWYVRYWRLRSRDLVGGGRVGQLSGFVYLSVVYLVFYILILVYFSLSPKKSVSRKQDFLGKRSVTYCPFPHWLMSLAVPHFSELGMDIRLKFSTVTFLSVNLFSFGEKHVSF